MVANKGARNHDGQPKRALPGPSSAAKRLRLQQDRQSLPMWSARERLLEQVKASSILVVIGETGSGKTTQIPRFLYDAGYAMEGMIACTQPRRVAAVTVAQRVADEMGVELGQQVGYSIRFEDRTSLRTRVKYMTDGMLLREALVDRLLSKYQVVLLDEAHERTVATDVLFGLLKGIVKQRTDGFRLIIMSATLDAAAFTRYFDGAKAAYVQGRQFPVEVLYTAEPEESYVDAALITALQIHSLEPPGDVLVFLTGQDEIESSARLLVERAAALPPVEGCESLSVLPIYAALPAEQQLKVFQPAPENTRKIILATNIAETSITIAGVRYVVDTGFVKSRSYSARLGADCLQVMPVSQAQARQRSGRAGREASGKAFRLYTEASFEALPKSTLPEIQRTNLGSVVLQLKALGIDDILNFDFMDPPPKAALLRSLQLLVALDALDVQGKLTETGQQLARLPVDPMYAKVLLASGAMGCSEEALAIVSMVSTDPIFHMPREKREKADEARKQFISLSGDHLTFLTVFRAYKSVSQKDKVYWCKSNFINARAMRKAMDIYNQLLLLLLSLRVPIKSCCDDDVPIRRALVSGLFSHAAKRQMDGSYKVIATSQSVALHPSSVLCGKKAECIVFDQLVRTSRQYARDATVVDATWLPELAPAYFARKQANEGGPSDVA